MPTQFTGRVTLIVAVVLLALWAIFPRGDFRHPDLKPGIDMVGGTSLLYEIKVPENWVSTGGRTLAEDVMESLKKRVDPSGVRNLIWRPQGNTRLEIQMPLTGRSAESKTRKDEFLASQKELEATNVRVLDVLSAVEELTGEKRDAKLKQLAMDSADRQQLYADLAKTWDDMKAAQAAKDREHEAQASIKYDELKEQIGRTNLSSQQLTDVLEIKDETVRTKKVDELKQRFAGFPSRVAAIDSYSGKYARYAEVKGAIDDAGELKRLLKGSGVLEFHILATPPSIGGSEYTISQEEYKEQVDRLQKDGPQVRAGDVTRWFLVDKPEEFKHQTVQYNDKNYALAYIDKDRAITHKPGAPAWGLQGAYPDNSEANRKVAFQFDPKGSQLFGDLTGTNIGKPLGIVLDDKLISAPRINSQIMGHGVITGGGAAGFTEAEQRYLVATLGAGSLPAQLTDEPVEDTVGPQLGADNLKAGLYACGFGLVVVAAFLVGYYYLAGIVAFIAVVMNVILILGIMAMLNATFTLPGVAGIVLAIGAAVDANVLIFERLREEQHRGLSIRMALRNSYDRAWSAILDSNMTTVITSFVLYWLGTEEVKGFGITLLIGLCSSMFTSLFVTKTIFGILIEKFGITDLGSLPRSIPKWDQMLQPKIDWIAKVWYFVAISAVFTVVGLSAFVYYGKKGELLDTEFAGGTLVQFQLKQPMTIEQVRKLLPAESVDLPSPAIVTVGTDSRTYQIVTPSDNSAKVRQIILQSLGDQLTLEVPSKFEGVEQKVNEAVDKQILPLIPDRIDDVRAAAGGFVPAQWRSFRGGAAVVLKNLDPKLTPEQIRDRIERQRLQPTAGQGENTSFDLAVESPNGPGQPTDVAVVLAANERFPFDQDPGKWREELASPVWGLLGEAINHPATFQRFRNFNATLAGDNQRDAMLALALSLIAIMAYIWLRFGNLKYGTATMIAMLHDTVLVLAAIGLSHLLTHAAAPVAGALLLEPFRLNITIVAAVLTVMSYSMIDTIVVFDRVRENRGKYGHLSKQILNDSINQTMSRTLLTAGTNIVTLFFMYIFGGPGIHGFTFVLLFGILIGTYSSVAIAAPILLLGRREPDTAGAAAAAATGKKAGVPATAAGKSQLQRVGG